MKKLLAAWAALAAVALVLAGIPASLRATAPDYPSSLAVEHVEEKLSNSYLLDLAAREEDSLLIFGSSELKTTDICTHPANFFRGSGLQVDLAGRGSCQSLVHALAVGGLGEGLRGRKLVLITAPQSYVEDGIAPDMFLANYSERQLLTILDDPVVPDPIKTYLAGRVQDRFAAYAEDSGTAPEAHTAGDVLSRAWMEGSPRWIYAPYAALSSWLLEAKDLAAARMLLQDGTDEKVPLDLSFDWDAWGQKALEQAAEQSTNNEFYMQDGYYSTYIGAKLAQQAGKDQDLDYDSSPEYGDLQCLLDLCALRDVQVLLVHVPMHGQWNDYTGFSSERRARYYQRVRDLAGAYPNVELLDLTGFEYEPYFLCDTMHLGWKGWLAVDRAMVDFYRADRDRTS